MTLRENQFDEGRQKMNRRQHLTTVLPLHCVVVGGALGAAHSVDAAVHHCHPDPVAGNVERRSLAPLIGHGVVAAEGAGFRVGAAAGLERQVPATDLDSPVGEGEEEGRD